VAPTAAGPPSGRRGVSSPRRADVSGVWDDEKKKRGAGASPELDPLSRMLAIRKASGAVAVPLRSSELPRTLSSPVPDELAWWATGPRRHETSTPLSGMAPSAGGGLTDSRVSKVLGDARLP
jgi:hypothetical protein